MFKSFQFIEVSPDAVLLDTKHMEKEDDGYVYNHLRYCLSKSICLPAVAVKSINGRLVSVARHKYLAIAQELGHERIRAVLQDETFEKLKAEGVSGLLSVAPKSELEKEQATVTMTGGWHIFFFKLNPPREVATQIDERFRRFLNQSLPDVLGSRAELVINSRFDFSEPCFEISFPTPVQNHVWANSFLALIKEYISSLT
jgi:hypothetical protein